MIRGTVKIENESMVTNYKSLMDNNLNAGVASGFFHPRVCLLGSNVRPDL